MAPPTSKYKSATYYPTSEKYVIEDENGIKTEIKKKEFISYGPVSVASGGVLADNTTSTTMDNTNNDDKQKQKKQKQTNG
jgi:hypothetical protein